MKPVASETSVEPSPVSGVTVTPAHRPTVPCPSDPGVEAYERDLKRLGEFKASLAYIGRRMGLG